jgi:hypothetical protein
MKTIRRDKSSSCFVAEDSSGVTCQQAEDLHASVDHYFECIEECRVQDDECTDECTESLKEEDSL